MNWQAKPLTLNQLPRLVNLVQNANDIPGDLSLALHSSLIGKKGPALLDIPVDVFLQTVTEDCQPISLNNKTMDVDKHEIEKVIRFI